jgi:hypothetical protein
VEGARNGGRYVYAYESESEGAEKVEGTEKSASEEEKNKQQQQKIGGEERVPELLQWKDREMADETEKLMNMDTDGGGGRKVGGEGEDDDVEMGG